MLEKVYRLETDVFEFIGIKLGLVQSKEMEHNEASILKSGNDE